MFSSLSYTQEQLVTSDNEDTADERVKAAKELVANYNQLVMLVEAFTRIARNLPRY